MWTVYKSSEWSLRRIFIVVDEAHCVVIWSDRFRKEYGQIGLLRAVLPRATMLALTGTCSKRMQSAIKSSLLIENCLTISSTIDRPNIYFSVCQRESSTGHKHSAEVSFTKVLKLYLDELQFKMSSFEKTIIFCKKEWCGVAYERAFIKQLCQYTSMYHADCTDEVTM